MQFAFLTGWRDRSAIFVTFVLAALASGSAVYWILQWHDAPLLLQPVVATTTAAPADSTPLARLLGASQSTSSAVAGSPGSSMYRLLGVIAHGNGGSALIAVGSGPAKPYRVGDRVDDGMNGGGSGGGNGAGSGLLLLSVQARSAALAPSLGASASITLDLPAPSASAAASASSAAR